MGRSSGRRWEEESGEGSWEKTEHKGSLKTLETGHFLWSQACREFLSLPGRRTWKGKGERMSKDPPMRSESHCTGFWLILLVIH